MGTWQGQNTQLTLLEQMEGSELLLRHPEGDLASSRMQHACEANNDAASAPLKWLQNINGDL